MDRKDDYRKLLKAEFLERSRANGRYSLRAFARDIEVSPAHVSQIFSGSRGLSASAANKIAQLLGWKENEARLFTDMVEADHGRSTIQREAARLRMSKGYGGRLFRHLSDDEFRLISDWHHLAILQLIELPRSKHNPAWIANSLGIKTSEAMDALERMTRLKLIEVRGKKIRRIESYVKTSDDVPSESIRSFHRQILSKATASLDSQSLEEREVSAAFVAIDPDQLPEAKQALRKFRRKFCLDISEKGDSSQVYCLSTQFFAVSARTKRIEDAK
jgi:uncharacterized protein (TIGR02147 family)